MASGGLRVLGVAKAHFKHTRTLPGEQHDFVFEHVGLVGLADPVRPMVPQAVRECYTAGIRVVMITGHGTAEVIAEATKVRVNGLLFKPFTPNELVEATVAALKP